MFSQLHAEWGDISDVVAGLAVSTLYFWTSIVSDEVKVVSSLAVVSILYDIGYSAIWLNIYTSNKIKVSERFQCEILYRLIVKIWRGTCAIALRFVHDQKRWPYSIVIIDYQLIVIQTPSLLRQNLYTQSRWEVSISDAIQLGKKKLTESYPVGGAVKDVLSCSNLQPLSTTTLLGRIAFKEDLQSLWE